MTMNMKLSFAAVLSVVLFAVGNHVVASEGSVQYKPGNGKFYYRPYCPVMPVSGQSTSYAPRGKDGNSRNGQVKNAWSGSREELEAIAKAAERKYGFENSKHLGRNATMLVPASFDEMLQELAHGNELGWKVETSDGYHAPNAKRGDSLWTARQKSGKGEIVKFTNGEGGEVVYNLRTGRIVKDEKMGTRNFEPEYKGGLLKMLRHKTKDVDPHNENKKADDRFSKDGDQYKYVGILYERDPDNPNKYYIIDGQTGLPMTSQQAAEMPTTLSDMWRDMGLVCVENDSKDVIPAKEEPQQSIPVDESQRPDIHSLNLDDPSGDWCKCENPGCSANMVIKGGYVRFGCSKCKKVNVKYARMALELEQKMMAAGEKGEWYGPNAETNARRAASDSNK